MGGLNEEHINWNSYWNSNNDAVCVVERMKIGLIDVDGHNYPNLALMKISAYHKTMEDQVDWYQPMFSSHQDKVYMSKVFSFTPDYEYYIDADEVSRGGTGYCIELVEGKEVYHKERDSVLPSEIEHQYPDYSLYNINNTAYGFLTRGCPRGCDFCHVKDKEGRKSYKVANLDEFWRGQPNIELLDPNMFACKDWKDLAGQLIDSKATINMNQGVDIRLLTEEMMGMLGKMKLSQVHFAWDRYEDGKVIVPKMKMYKEITNCDMRKTTVYMLTNFDTTFEQDLERVYTIRDCGFTPYVMIYDKQHCSKQSRRLQRWVNNRFIFRSCERFEDYGKTQNDNSIV